jgi:hypothetical protein
LAGVPGRGNSRAAQNWAALTYARRYALFTLVGIAGEDDLYLGCGVGDDRSCPVSKPRHGARNQIVA